MSTHVDSPIEKYIRHVQTVTHGSTANQMIATAIARSTKRTARRPCCESLRASRTVGSLEGISGAYTGKILSNGPETDVSLLTFRERIWMFAHITCLLFTVSEPCRQTVEKVREP